MLIMLLTLISTCMQNIIWILLVHNLFLAANLCKYTVRYAVRLPMWYMRRLDLCNINFFPRIPAEETGLRGEPLNRPKPPGHTVCSGNPVIMSSVVQRGPSFGWLAWSINSSVGGVSGWFSSSDQYSCHRALHSGSDVTVLPALSLIGVEKLRLPDRRRDAHYFNEQTTRNKFTVVFNIKLQDFPVYM